MGARGLNLHYENKKTFTLAVMLETCIFEIRYDSVSKRPM